MKDIQEQLLADVEKLFERKQFKSLKKLLSAMEPADVAEILEEKPTTERIFLFRLLPKDLAIEVFENLQGSEREELLNSFTDTEVAALIEEMSDDDRTALFDELPAKTMRKLLAHLSPEERKLANALLNFPSHSTGRLMTPEFIDLKESMTACQALDRIRSTAAKKETIYTTFVMGPDRKLKGTVHLEDLILAAPDTPITVFMDELPVHVSTDTDQEEAASTMSKYDLQALPVVDKEDRLVGIVTFDDILDIVQDEATEDFERMAGISPVNEDYLDAGVLTLSRKRMTWLLVCIFTQFFSSFIMERYSYALESVVALAFFIPLLIDTGGNTGTQASTLVIRAFIVGGINKKDFFKVISKEMTTGFILGSFLAVLSSLLAWRMVADVRVVATVAISVVGVVMMGNVVGAFLPFAAKKFNIDPAVMSGPLITTVVDILGLMLYFEIARFVLRI